MFLHLSVILSPGGCLPRTPGQTPPGQTTPEETPPEDPPGQTPPAQCMLGYGQQAGGTHPTGMHSCLRSKLR